MYALLPSFTAHPSTTLPARFPGNVFNSEDVLPAFALKGTSTFYVLNFFPGWPAANDNNIRLVYHGMTTTSNN